jgi:hypothetical protein
MIGGGLAKAGLWLVRNPAIMMTAVVTIAFIMVVVSKNSEINTLNKSINDPKVGWIARYNAVQADNGTLKLNNAALGGSVATQNAALATLIGKADTADAKFDAAMAQLRGSLGGFQTKMARLDAAQPGADKCSSALALIKGSAK